MATKNEQLDEALAAHLEVLTKTKRALLDLGEEFLEERPDTSHLLLQICRSLSLSSKRLVEAIKEARSKG